MDSKIWLNADKIGDGTYMVKGIAAPETLKDAWPYKEPVKAYTKGMAAHIIGDVDKVYIGMMCKDNRLTSLGYVKMAGTEIPNLLIRAEDVDNYEYHPRGTEVGHRFEFTIETEDLAIAMDAMNNLVASQGLDAFKAYAKDLSQLEGLYGALQHATDLTVEARDKRIAKRAAEKAAVAK